jgi:aminopeptidase-like protein
VGRRRHDGSTGLVRRIGSRHSHGGNLVTEAELRGAGQGYPVEAAIVADDVGAEIYDRIGRLYPICRSITGNGVRETLQLIGREIELAVTEVPTGTPVLDWVVPREWNIRDAYVKNHKGDRVVDFHASNLHVVNYSVPVHRRMSLDDLRPHLFSLPDHPDWIPYKTSYYRETWGFCVSHRTLESFGDGEYEVCVDSTLEDGHLTFGECILPGVSNDEVLFSCHVCHPSLCNDNLSGVSVATTLARVLATRKRRYTYRFLFAPGTIGAITWLALNEARVASVRHGLVLACVGDRGSVSYKRSRRATADIDRAVALVLRDSGEAHEIRGFSPYGYDERQYCSPGFDMPVGVLSRTPHGRFPEYHTSADNLELVDPIALADSLKKCLAIVDVLETNARYQNLFPRGEPQLGRRGLYSAMGGHSSARAREEALLWVLNLSDGAHDLLDIAERSGQPFASIRDAADSLRLHGLLSELPSSTSGGRAK